MARVKHIEAFCTSCNTIQKMEITGETSGEESENKRWAKCKKCKQVMVVDVSNTLGSKLASLEGLETTDCTVYSPLKTYEIGEPIYHQNWDDLGKVISKNTLSNGQKSITVEFQKSGSKKLIEALNN
jgi:hypothetical protein